MGDVAVLLPCLILPALVTLLQLCSRTQCAGKVVQEQEVPLEPVRKVPQMVGCPVVGRDGGQAFLWLLASCFQLELELEAGVDS